MDNVLIFAGFAAGGYVLAIYTWPALRTFIAGAEQEMVWLKARLSEIEAKVRDTLRRRG